MNSHPKLWNNSLALYPDAGASITIKTILIILSINVDNSPIMVILLKLIPFLLM
jgi:hypothetical protein